MLSLNGANLAILTELYRQNHDSLNRLGYDLRSLVRLSEDFGRLTGLEVEPWELWETIILYFGQHPVSRGTGERTCTSG